MKDYSVSREGRHIVKKNETGIFVRVSGEDLIHTAILRFR